MTNSSFNERFIVFHLYLRYKQAYATENKYEIYQANSKENIVISTTSLHGFHRMYLNKYKTRISLNKSVVFKIKVLSLHSNIYAYEKKNIYFFICYSPFKFCITNDYKSRTSLEMIEQDIHNISISVYGSVLRIEGANDEMLQIYNVTGVCVMRS